MQIVPEVNNLSKHGLNISYLVSSVLNGKHSEKNFRSLLEEDACECVSGVSWRAGKK